MQVFGAEDYFWNRPPPRRVLLLNLTPADQGLSNEELCRVPESLSDSLYSLRSRAGYDFDAVRGRRLDPSKPQSPARLHVLDI